MQKDPGNIDRAAIDVVKFSKSKSTRSLYLLVNIESPASDRSPNPKS